VAWRRPRAAARGPSARLCAARWWRAAAPPLLASAGRVKREGERELGGGEGSLRGRRDLGFDFWESSEFLQRGKKTSPLRS